MNDELLLAVDAGTGSCRAVVFDTGGRQLKIGQREYAHAALPGVPGSQAFDTARNWELICACIREALDGVDGGAIKAVAATSMREGMVLYDRRGREVWACPNVDSRASVEVRELVQSGAAEEIFAQSGDWVAITAPARFRWIARHQPDLLADVAGVGMLGDWIGYRLCGEFFTDPSLGSSSGMFDLAARDWSDAVIELCQLDRAIFPPVFASGTVAGGVTGQAAEVTGLPKGTPVVVGGADTQLGLLGIGLTQPGRVAVVGGSFWQCTAVLDQPLIDPQRRLRTLCHVRPERWMMEGIGFLCGLVMRWFRDGFCEFELQEARESDSDVYAILERKAASVPPGANGVIGLFSNVMQADHWVHGTPGFLGFDIGDPEHAGRIECFRAIEESAALVTRAHLEIIGEVTGTRPKEIVLTGGAAKGTLWPEILADTLDLPVRIPAVKESTALGAALCAGVGAGIYLDLESAATAVTEFEDLCEPTREHVTAYDELYERWRSMYPGALDLSEKGHVRPLWRAAGT